MRALALLVLILAGAPARSTEAKITFANDAARAAAAAPGIAAVLARCAAGHDATIDHDVAGFAADQAPELVVNSPANRVLTGAMTIGAFKAGMIDYSSAEMVIEYAALRPNGEVLLMGEEHIAPRGATRNAGHDETYRVTEIWRNDGGRWLLSVRHATITAVR